MKRLTKYEKENIFLSNAAEDYWSVYINSKPFKKRFKEYDDKYAGILIHEHTDQFGGELYKVPKNCISIRLLPPRTDEQQKKAKEHAKNVGHGSASTTLNFYAHVDKSSKISIADTLDKLNSEQEKKEDKVSEKVFEEKTLSETKKDPVKGSEKGLKKAKISTKVVPIKKQSLKKC